MGPETPPPCRYPLRPAQRRIWTGQQRDPGSPLYHMVFLFRLPSDLDPTAWTEAFLDVVEESNVLRTVVRERDGIPECLVLPRVRPAIEQTVIATDALTWARERCRLPLPLQQRLWDAAWLKEPAGTTAWYLNQHHLITDGVSIVRIVERHMARYRMRAAGEPDPSGPPPDYVSITDSLLHEAESQAAASRDYWATVCRDAASRLPIFGESAEPVSTRSTRRTLLLTEEQENAVTALSRAPAFRGFTPDAGRFHVFAALIAAWLARVTGERTITLDCPVHNRTTPEARRTIGLFMETLPLTVPVGPGTTFSALGETVRGQSLEFLKHVHPGAPLPPGWRGAPAVLNVLTSSFPPWNDRPIPVEWVHPGHADRDHRVRVQVHDFSGAGRTTLHLDWLEDTVPAGDQERAGAALERLLDAFSRDPGLPVDAVDVLNDDERRGLLEGFNDTGAAPQPKRTVIAEIARTMERRPGAIAAQCGDTVWTYGDLDARADAVARAVAAFGLPDESLVGLFLPRSLDALAAVVGVLRAGGAFVPLDPRHPPERIRRIIEQARPPLLITASDDPPAGGHGPRVRLDELPTPPVGRDPLLPPPLDRLAYVIYTSGSTGTPKGVEIEHAGLADYLTWAERTYAEGPIAMPWFTSLSFDLTLTSVFLPLMTGGTVHVYPEGDEPVDDAIRRVVLDNRCDAIKLTPSHLAVMRQLDLGGSRIRTLILGGEDLKASWAADIQARLGPNVVLYNEYGPTEAVVGCMIHRFDPERDRSGSVPIGRPADHVELFVVNEAGRLAPRGVPGELCIARFGLARGYHRDPGQTAASFVPHPFRAGARIYRSGDRVRFSAPDCLTYLGRIDRQLKIRGLRIEPGEIETALEALPGIDQAAVRFLPSPPARGSGAACVRCGIDDAVPGVEIEASGLCNLCRRYEAIRERAQAYFRTPDDLRREIDAAQEGNRSGYHCLVLVSGGKDSTYTLGQIVGMGYRVLAFTLDNGYLSDQAKENIRRVAAHFGVDHHFETTDYMPEIFRDSLHRFSNVCQGCFKAIYTLAYNRADALGIPVIITGLSRGQFFETRLTEHLFEADGFSPDEVDAAVLAARRLYHRMDDAVTRRLDTSRFRTDAIFRRVRVLDFFRYWDVRLDELLRWLREEVPWIRPEDTGRSTNCLINDVGIYVHRRERGFHNYALPYSWDVRLGHKTREAAVQELNDEFDLDRVRRILREIDYPEPPPSRDGVLAAYFTGTAPADPATLRRLLARALPEAALPDVYEQVDRMPLAASGKVDYAALPMPMHQAGPVEISDDPPATDVERRIAEIWQAILQRPRIGRRHHFFDVGGHSLAAMEMMYRLCREFAVDLPLAVLFETPVLRDLAERVEDAILREIEALSEEEAASRL